MKWLYSLKITRKEQIKADRIGEISRVRAELTENGRSEYVDPVVSRWFRRFGRDLVITEHRSGMHATIEVDL